MASSEIEIVNQAATRAEISDLLDDTTEDQTLEAVTEGLTSPLAVQARIWYPKCRDLVLRRPLAHAVDWSWPFATVREVLALTEETRDSWSYVYAYPADCLAFRFIPIPGLRNPRADQRVKYQLEARRGPVVEGQGRDTIGKLILTDQEDAEGVYVVQVTNPSVFPVDFEEALTWRLAAEFARGITKGETGRRLADTAMAYFDREVRVAIAAAVNEEKRDDAPKGELEASRTGR